MKLRNKKTGESIDIDKLPKNLKEALQICAIYFWRDYEICEPAEPLIEDEKARKVFREWAELFGAEQFLVNHLCDSRRKTTSIGSVDITTEPAIELPGHIGEDSQIYTRVELCGEEEE